MKKNKLNITMLVFAFLILSFVLVSPQNIYANTNKENLREEMLQMDDEVLLSTLLDNGLILPKDYDAHKEMSLNFVAKYVPLILNGTYDSRSIIFNYSHSNEMMRNVALTLEKMNITRKKKLYASSYSLSDSTVLGSWYDSYENYNCYAYSIGAYSWLVPGDYCGENFSLTMSISSMADLVLSDLESKGNWGYTTSSKPNQLPDRWFKIIAIRKDTDNVDFHFMKRYGSSLSSWAHKPSYTQPLKWNYSSPGSKIWSNEAVYKGVAYEPTLTYDSSVYYIIYKSKDDPGIQDRKLLTGIVFN